MKFDLTLIFIDDHLLAIDKPAGILAIPDRWDPDVPVARSMLEKQYGSLFPVHRIDRDTSGVLLYARNLNAHRSLSLDFSTRQVIKEYIAIVRGEPSQDSWDVDFPLRMDGDRMHRTVIDKSKGKESFTHFEVVERFRGYALVRALPETGRTHQIRVHLAASQLPILADPLYGDGNPLFLSQLKRRWKGDAYEERPLMARTALHASRISFEHPVLKTRLVLEAPEPRDFRATLAQMRKLLAL
ncbi:MAG: RluA family pseudouridine synthase [Rectinema sp.]|nr:RluA family pseudouridine synthase [Rectinema sp.]